MTRSQIENRIEEIDDEIRALEKERETLEWRIEEADYDAEDTEEEDFA